MLQSLAADRSPRCEWKVTILNGKTREKREFSPSAQAFRLPLDGLRGFSHCEVSPIRILDLPPTPSTPFRDEGTNVHVFCFTSGGAAFDVQVGESKITGADVLDFWLYAPPVKVSHPESQQSEVASSDYRHVELLCTPFGS